MKSAVFQNLHTVFTHLGFPVKKIMKRRIAIKDVAHQKTILMVITIAPKKEKKYVWVVGKTLKKTARKVCS